MKKVIDNNFHYVHYSLAFFFHASVAVQLLQQQPADDDYCCDKWKSHLSRLAVQIPMAIVWNAFIVAHSHVLYEIRTYHGYVFICLLLESVYGIHFGKHKNKIGVIFFQTTNCFFLLIYRTIRKRHTVTIQSIILFSYKNTQTN